MSTLVAGKTRTDLLLANKVPINMDNHIAELETSKYLFEYLVRQIRESQEEDNMKVEFMEDRPYPITMICSAAESGTTISVDFPARAHKDELIYNTRTKEIYLMNEDVGGGSAAGKITVVNHSGSGNITNATAAGDVLIRLMEAHAEGEAIPPAFSVTPATYFTYLMQSDQVNTNTDIQKRSREYGKTQIMLNRKKTWIDYKRRKDLIFYLGEHMREVTSASGPRRHTCRGLENWIQTNKIDFTTVGGGLTPASLGELMRRTMNHTSSSSTKIAILGQNAWAHVSNLPENAIRTTVTETSWGKRLNTLVTPHGTQSIGYDPQLIATNGLADRFYLLDPGFINHMHLRDEPERLLVSIGDNTDIHNDTDAVTGTFGLKLGLEELHAMGFGID